MKGPWPREPLGQLLHQRKEIVTIDDLAVYRRPRVQLHAQGIVLRDEVPGALVKTKQQQVCRVGELLVAEIDAKVGGIGIVPDALGGAIVSSHYFLFEIDETKLDRRFLAAFVQTRTFLDQIEAQGSTNYAAIRPADVLGYEIPLPPIVEQRRVVTHIEELAAKIHEARTLRHQAREEVEVLVASYANFVLTNEARRWPTCALEVVAEIRSGVTLGRRLEGQTVRLPYLRVANVQDGHLDLSEIKHVEVLESEAEKWKLLNGDLLLTEGGDWDKQLGRGAVWRGEITHCIHQNHIFCVRTRAATVLPEFLAALISSPIGKAYFQQASKQTTNLASINQRQLKALPVFQPTLPEQRRIVFELEALQAEVEALKGLLAESFAELDALLRAVLDRVFKGEL